MYEIYPPARIRIIFLTILCLSFQGLFSQIIQNEVVATTGDIYVIEDNEIAWTLGESIIESFQSDQFIITQGFHQPSFWFDELPEQQNPGFTVNVFPNPANQFVRIQLTEPETNEKFHLTICDITGKLYLDQAFDSALANKIDLSQISEGILFLTITRLKDGGKKSFKIVRSD